MPLNKVVKMFVSKPENIETLSIEDNQVAIAHKIGSDWEEVKLIPKSTLNIKPSLASEGRINELTFKSKVINPPDHDFYIVKLIFADDSTQLIGNLDFPVYIISGSEYSDSQAITTSFTYKTDHLLSSVET